MCLPLGCVRGKLARAGIVPWACGRGMASMLGQSGKAGFERWSRESRCSANLEAHLEFHLNFIIDKYEILS